MGLSQSFRRRFKLIKGESPSTAFKIFFASKKKRRAFEFKKFGYYLNGFDALAVDLKPIDELDVLRSCLDESWYADTFQLASPGQAMDHYLTIGKIHAFAPSIELADETGKTLSAWGLEYLVRCGVKVGDTGEGTLLPDDTRAIDPFKIENADGKKVAVITAIFGGHDELLPINRQWTKNADFFVFSDCVFAAAEGWQQVHAPYHHVDPRRKARFIKLNLPIFFQNYDWVIWVDGNILICQDPVSIVSGVNDGSFEFATFLHSQRNGILAEAAACTLLGKESAREIAAHLANSSKHEAFRNKTMFGTMVMVLRPSSSTVQKLFATWWKLLAGGSKRDQLSLPLAMAESPDLRFAPLPDTIEQSADFFRTKHSVKTGQDK